MHIDDMRQGPQFVESLQSAASFDSGFPTHKEENRGTDENHGTNRRVEALHRVDEIVELEFVNIENDANHHRDDEKAEERRHEAKQQVGTLNPFGARNGFFGDVQQFADDLAQARAGKTFIDSSMKRLHRLDDLLGIELAKFGVGFFHD